MSIHVRHSYPCVYRRWQLCVVGSIRKFSVSDRFTFEQIRVHETISLSHCTNQSFGLSMLFVRSLTAGAVTGNFTQKDDIIENHGAHMSQLSKRSQTAKISAHSDGTEWHYYNSAAVMIIPRDRVYILSCWILIACSSRVKRRVIKASIACRPICPMIDNM